MVHSSELDTGRPGENKNVLEREFLLLETKSLCVRLNGHVLQF